MTVTVIPSFEFKITKINVCSTKEKLAAGGAVGTEIWWMHMLPEFDFSVPNPRTEIFWLKLGRIA